MDPQTRQELIADVAAELVMEKVIDTTKFSNVPEAVGHIARVIDESLAAYEIVRKDAIMKEAEDKP